MTLTDRIQRAVIHTSPYPPFRWMYAAVYGAILLWLILRLRRIPEIRRLEWREPHKGHRFGASDLDIRAETLRLSAAEFFALSDRLADIIRPTSRWHRILDFYLFGPEEAQLQRRLGPMSFGSSRPIRLLGPKDADPSTSQASMPEPENAVLCRSFYEYGYLLQELFERTPNLHFTWTTFRRIKRIDEGFRARHGTLDPESAAIRERTIARADRIVAGGALRELEASALEDLFVVARGELDSISQTALCSGGGGRDRIFRLVENPVASENLPDAVGSCSAQVNELCSHLEGRVQSAMLGSVPATSFDYRLYLILRDGLSVPDLLEVFRAIRAMYTSQGSYRRIPVTYLRLRYPTVLTRAMWRASSYWYHALRPVEEFFYLQHHGAVLWGDDLRGELTQPAAADMIRSAAIAGADLRNMVWDALHDNRPRRLVDTLLGRIPALWLLLARSTIATTSKEALSGCVAGDFPEVSRLVRLNSQLLGIRPEKLPAASDPVWKPALEASSQWIDEIAQRALVRLESGFENASPMVG